MTKVIEGKDLKYHSSGYGKVALLTEPYLLHPEDYITAAAINFDMVLTNHLRFTERFEKWHYYPLGGCHLSEEDRVFHKKTKNVSMFVSGKDTMPGHRLRMEACEQLEGFDIDFYGEYVDNYVENKADGLRDYRFSIVVESCRERGYFTEKIIDCFLTGTIPIYWGDPDIGFHFDTGGILPWYGDFEKLGKLLTNIEDNGEEIYQNFEKAARRNFPEARAYTDYATSIKRIYPRLFND